MSWLYRILHVLVVFIKNTFPSISLPHLTYGVDTAIVQESVYETVGLFYCTHSYVHRGKPTRRVCRTDKPINSDTGIVKKILQERFIGTRSEGMLQELVMFYLKEILI